MGFVSEEDFCEGLAAGVGLDVRRFIQIANVMGMLRQLTHFPE